MAGPTHNKQLSLKFVHHNCLNTLLATLHACPVKLVGFIFSDRRYLGSLFILTLVDGFQFI